MWDVLVCLVLHRFVNGSILLFRLLALWPYIDEYSWQHVEHLQALELLDWNALKDVYEVLGLTQATTEWLEGEHIPTGWRALKYLWWFVCIMAQRSPSDWVAVLNAQQHIAILLAWTMGDEMMAELDDPNWMFAMEFMAYMDPSDEYFVVDPRSMYLGDKQLYQCPFSEVNIVIAACCMMWMLHFNTNFFI